MSCPWTSGAVTNNSTLYFKLSQKKTHFASLIPHFKETLLNDKANYKSTEEYRSADLDDALCATR